MRAITFATSVLPTPAWPSIRSGFFKVIARCTDVGIAASVTYSAASIISWIFLISALIVLSVYTGPRAEPIVVGLCVHVVGHRLIHVEQRDPRGHTLDDRAGSAIAAERSQLVEHRAPEQHRIAQDAPIARRRDGEARALEGIDQSANDRNGYERLVAERDQGRGDVRRDGFDSSHERGRLPGRRIRVHDDLDR